MALSCYLYPVLFLTRRLLILLLPLLWDRADNDLLLLVGSASGAASGGASAVAIDVGDGNGVFLCASSRAVAASNDNPGT